ncbi:MAG: response regulator [Bacteroidota bacterium]
MIKCFVIDDEQAAINVLIKFIERTADLKLVGSTTNPVRGISLIQKEEPDVVFLDIQMDGIEVLKRIHTISKVVFCTAYSEFAVQSYDLDVIDYLMKPITFPRFSRAIQRVTDTIYSRPSFSEEIVPNDYMFIKSGQRDIMIRIDLDDIDFVESLNHYVAFHTGNKKLWPI